MVLEITDNNLAANSWFQAHPQAVESNESALNQTEISESHAINSDILSFTRMVRNRAEVAAMQLAASVQQSSKMNMQDVSDLQDAGKSVAEVRSILMRLTELASKAFNASDRTEASNIQAEVSSLNMQLRSLVSTKESSKEPSTESTKESNSIEQIENNENNADYLSLHSNSFENFDKFHNNLEVRQNLSTAVKGFLDNQNLSLKQYDAPKQSDLMLFLDNVEGALSSLKKIDEDISEKMHVLEQKATESLLQFQQGSNVLIGHDEAIALANETSKTILSQPEIASITQSQVIPAINPDNS